MNSDIPRRQFLKTAGAAGAGLAFWPGFTSQAADASGKKVVLALVGCAHIHTPGFVQLLKGRPDVVVKYVWDHEEARAAKRAKDLGSAVAGHPREVWADAEVAGVVICSETNRHRELVLEAAKARKHLFVEKPLGINSRESRAMADAIDAAKVLFTTGYFMRTEGPNLFLKEQVSKGTLGKITHVRASNCHSGSLGGWFDNEWRWMADPKQAGVGAFGDLGTHSLDILMWLLGEVEAVTADIKVVTGRYGDCDESGEALLRFNCGVTATLAAGWVDVANPVSLLISGTEGHAHVLDGNLYFKSGKVDKADGKEPWTQWPARPPLPLHQFVDALGGKPGLPLVTPSEAAARVSVMEAMYQAARKRAWVKPA